MMLLHLTLLLTLLLLLLGCSCPDEQRIANCARDCLNAGLIYDHLTPSHCRCRPLTAEKSSLSMLDRRMHT